MKNNSIHSINLPSLLDFALDVLSSNQSQRITALISEAVNSNPGMSQESMVGFCIGALSGAVLVATADIPDALKKLELLSR